MQTIKKVFELDQTSGKHVREMYTPLNLGVCRGIPNFLIFDPKHALWVPQRGGSNVYPQCMF